MRSPFASRAAAAARPMPAPPELAEDYEAPIPPPGAPATAFERARLAWFEAHGSAVVGRARYFVVAVVFGAAFICAAVALMVLMPLKSVVPFVLEKAEDGAVSPASVVPQQYSPGISEQRYFVAQWIRKLLTLDENLTETYLSEAYLQTRGKAIVEFTDWVEKFAPMGELRKDSTLTRTVSISSVSLIQTGVALVRVACERRSHGNPTALREKFVVTLHFSTTTPRSEAELLRNPIGLYVTHFEIIEDLEK